MRPFGVAERIGREMKASAQTLLRVANSMPKSVEERRAIIASVVGIAKFFGELGAFGNFIAMFQTLYRM